MKSKKENQIKNFFSKIWFIIWKDDSLKGWIVSLLVIFLFMKFLFFPLLGFLTGTALPLAIVQSCSMYHENNFFSDFDKWWEKNDIKYNDYNITKEDFEDFPFRNGMNKGDILFILGTDIDDLEVGDVMIFNAGESEPIIHRIVQIKEENGDRIFSTLGDNNPKQLFIERAIQENQYVGKAVLRPAPYVGWVKLIAVDLFKFIFGGNFAYINDGFCE